MAVDAPAARRGALTPRTKAYYGDLLDRIILPTFGKAKMSAIQPAQVRRWYGGVAIPYRRCRRPSRTGCSERS